MTGGTVFLQVLRRLYQRAQWLSLLLTLSLPAMVAGQAGVNAATAERTIVPNLIATTRFTDRLQVPMKNKASLLLQVNIAAWTSTARAREISVPPQGFYLATLENGVILTIINGEQKQRHAGEIWAVQNGQSMTIRIQNSKQENVLLRIVSLEPGH